MASAGMLYVVLALGALAIYLGMPRSEKSLGVAAVLCGAAALIGMTVFYAVASTGDAGADWFFYLCAAVAVIGSARVITHNAPVYSAMWFVLVVLAVALMMIMQLAEFLAVALVIIYAGAILVTYVFVIMLAQQSGPAGYDNRAREPLAAAMVGFVLMATVGGKIGQLPAEGLASKSATNNGQSVLLVNDQPAAVESKTVAADQTGSDQLDNTVVVGRKLLTSYIVALEVAGLLLLVAMVGAIAISKKKMPVDVPQPASLPLGQQGREAKPF
jgi:NADH-quinone oxidoreductase subunit J